MTEREFNQCVDQYADNVFRFILKNLRHEEDARDIVQASFEKLWRHRAQVTADKSKSYLFTIAYHEMIDHIRKIKRIRLADSLEEGLQSLQPSMPDSRSILEKALYRLSEQHRSLVLLKDYEGYSYQEIGAITGLSESQVKVYLHRARLQLRDYLVKPENII